MIWIRIIFIVFCFICLLGCGYVLDKQNPKISVQIAMMVGAIMILSLLIGLFLGIILCGLG